MKKVLRLIIIVFIISIQSIQVDAKSLFKEKEKYVIVIDPGHGGENLGTIANENFDEKEILLKTAFALVEELSKYDELEVYLTRDEDVDISLRDRAVFAKEVNADFLFSLHYNASENHSMFGTEVWIPLNAPYHSYCYKFAYLQQLEMQELGLFSRGIKTRKNDDNKDYYGIIRECVARKIPAVIIEHCYVDEERDDSYVDEEEDFIEFGRRDAIAIAKFLGVYEEMEDIPEFLYDYREKDTIADTYEDHIGPNICKIELEEADYENGVLTINVKAHDKQTPVMYYSYSIDGGRSYSKLFAWPEADLITGEYPESFSLMLNIPDNYTPEVLVRAYNKFDIYRTSNKLKNIGTFVSPTAPPVYVSKETVIPVVKQETTEEKVSQPVIWIADIMDTTPQEAEIGIKRFLLLLVFVIVWMFLLIFMVRLLYAYFKQH